MKEILMDLYDFYVINCLMDYCIYESTDRVKNRDIILKKMGLDSKTYCWSKLDDYLLQIESLALQIIKNNSTERIVLYSEFMRESYSNGDFPKEKLQYYISIDDASVWIQKMLVNNENHLNSVQVQDLLLLYELFFVYDEIEKKKEFSVNNLDYICEYTELLEPIDNHQLDEFIDNTALYFNAVKIEESELINEQLKEKLKKRKLLPHLIFEKNNDVLKNAVGFTYRDIDTFIERLKEVINSDVEPRCLFNKHHVRISKQRLVLEMTKYIPEDNVCSIIRILSINENVNLNSNITVRDLEIRCIFERDDNLSFGVNTIIKSLLMIKSMSICGHFPKTLNITKEKNDKFVSAQSDFSTYFSYYVGDQLEYFGYLLPKAHDGTIKVEIKKIMLSSKILDFNDIDVLALDVRNKCLLNLELKYFKGKVYYESVMTDGMDNKKYCNFMKRQMILEKNMSEILTNLFGVVDTNGYSVVPIVVTSRVNVNQKEVDEFSLEEFLQLLADDKLKYVLKEKKYT